MSAYIPSTAEYAQLAWPARRHAAAKARAELRAIRYRERIRQFDADAAREEAQRILDELPTDAPMEQAIRRLILLREYRAVTR